MKKIIILLMFVFIAFSLFGCTSYGGPDVSNGTSATDNVTDSEASSETSEAEDNDVNKTDNVDMEDDVDNETDDNVDEDIADIPDVESDIEMNETADNNDTADISENDNSNVTTASEDNKIELDDFETSPLWASIQLYEGSTPVFVDVIQEGTFTNYEEYTILIERVSPGYSFGAKWAKVSVYSNNNLLSTGTLNIGDKLSAGSIDVELTDLTIPYPDESCAILSENIVCTGSPVNINGEQVVLEKASPGYTLNAKWVKLMVGGISRTVDVGDSVTIGGQAIILDDISLSSPENSRASFQIVENQQVILEDSFSEGDSSSVDSGPDKRKFTILQVAPGYSFGAKWAKVLVDDGASPFTRTVSVGQSFELGNGMDFVLTDLTVSDPDRARASLSVLDGDGQVLSYQSIREEDSVFDPSLDSNIEIEKLSPGYTFASKWARIKVGDIEGIVNVGEEIYVGDLRVRLDDITVSYPETTRASLEFYDGGVLVEEESVSEGSSTQFSGITINIKTLEPGYLLNAKRSTMEVGGAENVMSLGDEFDLGGGKSFKLVDITTTHPSTSRASVRVNDASGNAVYYAAITEGDTQNTNLGFDIEVKALNPGYTFGAKWARLKVGNTEGIIHVGEYMLVGGYKILLEDLTITYK
ncbi:MAG TPA: hypothetical protein VI912_02935 [Candidatus Bilamarchaeaceae archaeon]|nr:hypothetical protein [Candidatus Bilamarchaeaceae archaeon]